MAVRKIGKWWWVDISYDFQRYRKRSPLNTKGGAQEYETFLRGELAKHQSLDHLDRRRQKAVEAAIPTFAEFAERWYEGYVVGNNRPKVCQITRSILRGHLVPAIGKLRLDQITPEHIERYKCQRLKARRSPKTINNHLTILRRCLGSAVEWKVLSEAPRFKACKLQQPKFSYLTAEEVETLLRAIPPGMLRMMVLLAARTGLRFSELIALEWQDIDLEQGFLEVRRSEVQGYVGPTKNHRVRRVPLTRDLHAAIAVLDRSESRIFHLPDRRRISHESMIGRLRGACRAAGVKPIGWHSLRHTFASQLVCSGAPIRAVQTLLGHSSLEMTVRYAHVDEDTLRETVALLEPGGSETLEKNGNRKAMDPENPPPDSPSPSSTD